MYVPREGRDSLLANVRTFAAWEKDCGGAGDEGLYEGL